MAEPWLSGDGVAVLSGGQTIYGVHDVDSCMNYWCPIHNESPHHMADWLMYWSGDHGYITRKCPHDIMHCDPDGSAITCTLECDECCRPPHRQPENVGHPPAVSIAGRVMAELTRQGFVDPYVDLDMAEGKIVAGWVPSG